MQIETVRRLTFTDVSGKKMNVIIDNKALIFTLAGADIQTIQLSQVDSRDLYLQIGLYLFRESIVIKEIDDKKMSQDLFRYPNRSLAVETYLPAMPDCIEKLEEIPPASPTLKRQNQRKFFNKSGCRWSAEDLAKVGRLINDGVDYKTVGKVINRSSKGVAHMHRAGKIPNCPYTDGRKKSLISV